MKRSLLFFLILFFTFGLYAQETVKIGILAKRGHDITLAEYGATAEYLSREIAGHRFAIVPIPFEKMQESVANHEIDFVITNTMDYVGLEYLYGVSRIATLKNISSSGGATTSFGGVILVRQESPIKSIKDLKNKHLGAVDENSFGGWIMARKELKDNGILLKDLAKVEFFGSHDKVVLAVRDGLVDAGTVRSDTLERMEREGLVDLSCCRVVEPKSFAGFSFAVSTQLYPEWPFAKLSKTSETLANEVLVALLKMPPDAKAARDAKIAGWTIPLDYSIVHDLMQELHIGPYAELGKLNFERFYEKYKLLFYSVIFTFLVIVGVLAYIYKLNTRLKENKEYIEALNVGLEFKVKERTAEIEKLYLHEKYLKNILKTIADINELLISSISTQSVVENSIERLVKHEHYRFVWIGLLKNNLLEMSIRSKDPTLPLVKRSYRLDSSEESFAFQIVKNSVLLEKTIAEELPEGYKFGLGGDDYKCNSCSIASIPIRGGKNEEVLGALTVFTEKEDGFKEQELRMLENLATDIGLALNTIYQRSKLKFMELEKISNYEETILAFVNIIEQRDSYTAGHTLRVAHYCRLIAQGFGMGETEIVKLEKAAILHDIGKVVTPDSILLKPGNLTRLEYELIKEHANAGYKMLSKINMYKDLAEIIKYHHARYDGKGYPATPKEYPNSIPFLSYIMAVADAFDAMTTNRIYKPRKSVEEALEEVKRFSGEQFHPEVAEVALKVLEGIDIEQTSQLPTNELEQRRFAYFFMDSLTDVYNETYLQTFLSRLGDEKKYMARIELKNFSSYNKEHGWSEGDRFLKEFALFLKAQYPNGMVFRYHGDNFILLFEQMQSGVCKGEIEKFPLFTQTKVRCVVNGFDLTKELPEI